MLPIQRRPAEVEHRRVLGHWGGDLVVGKRGGSHVATLVERVSRYLVVLHLPDGAGTDSVTAALIAAYQRMPAKLRRSLTWDRGRDDPPPGLRRDHEHPGVLQRRLLALAAAFNENSNGLLRQYLPKGTDLSVHTQQDLKAIADKINNGPRRVLGWHTPTEASSPTLL
jgi:IS30 family transposase